jgi:hypothetical protein
MPFLSITTFVFAHESEETNSVEEYLHWSGPRGSHHFHELEKLSDFSFLGTAIPYDILGHSLLVLAG